MLSYFLQILLVFPLVASANTLKENEFIKIHVETFNTGLLSVDYGIGSFDLVPCVASRRAMLIRALMQSKEIDIDRKTEKFILNLQEV